MRFRGAAPRNDRRRCRRPNHFRREKGIGSRLSHAILHIPLSECRVSSRSSTTRADLRVQLPSAIGISPDQVGPDPEYFFASAIRSSPCRPAERRRRIEQAGRTITFDPMLGTGQGRIRFAAGWPHDRPTLVGHTTFRRNGCRQAENSLPFKSLGTFELAKERHGAQKRTRTSTPVRALAPEASASTNSATWAGCRSASVLFSDGDVKFRRRIGGNMRFYDAATYG